MTAAPLFPPISHTALGCGFPLPLDPSEVPAEGVLGEVDLPGLGCSAPGLDLVIEVGRYADVERLFRPRAGDVAAHRARNLHVDNSLDTTSTYTIADCPSKRRQFEFKTASNKPLAIPTETRKSGDIESGPDQCWNTGRDLTIDRPAEEVREMAVSSLACAHPAPQPVQIETEYPPHVAMLAELQHYDDAIDAATHNSDIEPLLQIHAELAERFVATPAQDAACALAKLRFLKDEGIVRDKVAAALLEDALRVLEGGS